MLTVLGIAPYELFDPPKLQNLISEIVLFSISTSIVSTLIWKFEGVILFLTNPSMATENKKSSKLSFHRHSQNPVRKSGRAGLVKKIRPGNPVPPDRV
jgi:hypothetical protein